MKRIFQILYMLCWVGVAGCGTTNPGAAAAHGDYPEPAFLFAKAQELAGGDDDIITMQLSQCLRRMGDAEFAKALSGATPRQMAAVKSLLEYDLSTGTYPATRSVLAHTHD